MASLTEAKVFSPIYKSEAEEGFWEGFPGFMGQCVLYAIFIVSLFVLLFGGLETLMALIITPRG